MAEIQSAKTTRLLNRQPSATFSDDPQRDPLEGRTLYVLGLSVAGAIVASGILLIYFTSLQNKPRPFEADIVSRISVPDTTSWAIATRGSFSAKLANVHSVPVAQMRWPSQLPLRKHGHEGDCAHGCAVGPYARAVAADVIVSATLR